MSLLCLSSAFLVLPACDEDEGESSGEAGAEESEGGDGDGDGDPPEFWAVGQDSEMLRVNPQGAQDGYPLNLAAPTDLNDIACRGFEEAWVAGDNGLLLRTSDAGHSWRALASGTRQSLEGIAVSLDGKAWAVGDGTVLMSGNAGESWAEHTAAPAREYLAVDTDEYGVEAFAIDAQGAIWWFSTTHAQPIFDAALPLHDIAVAAHGEHIVAVGEQGHAWTSHDGGASFEPLDLAVTSDLYGADISTDGQRIVAVGAEGVLVVAQEGVVELSHPAGEGATLRDVHALASQEMQVVGDEGLILLRDHEGQWTKMYSPSGRDLLGIDAIGEAHH